MDTKIQSPLPRPRVYVTPAGCGSCSGVLVCLGGACRSRGAQNPKIDGCWWSFILSGHLDLVKLDLSFKTRILSPSNSPGRPRYGFGSVLTCSGWVPHALIWSVARFNPLKFRRNLSLRLSGHYREERWNCFEQCRWQIWAFNTAGRSAIWRPPA